MYITRLYIQSYVSKNIYENHPIITKIFEESSNKLHMPGKSNKTVEHKSGSTVPLHPGGASLIWSNMILTLATAVEPFVTTKGGCGETSPQEGLYVR